MKFKFTVFTPCYNSEKFIHRMYNSLCAQTFKDFEWLVIDDASSDSTLKILQQYQKESDFEMRILINETNQMLAKNFNIGFSKAKGELFIALGHDDAMKSDALEVLDSIWNKYQNENISGIWGVCEDQHGKLVGNLFPEDIFISNYFDVLVDYIWTKERIPCVRTALLNEIKFDTKELDYIPEDVIWGKIGLAYDTIFTNDILRIYYIEPENENSLTKRTRSQLAGYVVYQYSMWINEFLRRLKGQLKFKIRIYLAFLFYSFLDKKNAIIHLKKIDKVKDKIILLILSPIAMGIYLFMKLKKGKI